jgi:hypothetical protein
MFGPGVSTINNAAAAKISRSGNGIMGVIP